MESDTFNGDSMVKFIWRFSGSLFYHGFFPKTLDNLHKISLKNLRITLHTVSKQSPYPNK